MTVQAVTIKAMATQDAAIRVKEAKAKAEAEAAAAGEVRRRGLCAAKCFKGEEAGRNNLALGLCAGARIC